MRHNNPLETVAARAQTRRIGINDGSLAITCQKSYDKSIFRNLSIPAIRHVRRDQSRSPLVWNHNSLPWDKEKKRESQQGKIWISILKHAHEFFGLQFNRISLCLACSKFKLQLSSFISAFIFSLLFSCKYLQLFNNSIQC